MVLCNYFYPFRKRILYLDGKSAYLEEKCINLEKEMVISIDFSSFIENSIKKLVATVLYESYISVYRLNFQNKTPENSVFWV